MIEQIEQLICEGNLREACKLIKQSLKNGMDFQGRHVRYASQLMLNSDWQEITSLLPKDVNTFVTSGWLNSIAAGKPINAKGEPIPWLTYPAIDFLDTIIKSDWKVFEWGSGYSTLWWAKKIHHVYAVENNTEWYKEVKLQLPTNATIVNSPSENEFVNAINTYEDGYFNAIVIDGEFRNKCAKNCVPKLKQNGIIIFDNTDGIDFDESMLFLNSLGFFRLDFWGLIPSYMYKNCTSIFFRSVNIFRDLPPPSKHHSCVGISCYQAVDAQKYA
jgi:hypothetical protein